MNQANFIFNIALEYSIVIIAAGVKTILIKEDLYKELLEAVNKEHTSKYSPPYKSLTRYNDFYLKVI